MSVPWTRTRLNARGQVRCLACDQWLSREAFACPPSRKGTPWPYCRPCVRAIDRQRKRSIRGTPEWQSDQERRARQQRAAQRARRKERVEFVSHAITVLRRRGLTKAEITRLADVSFTSLLKWERRETLPDPQVAERFGALLLAMAHLPLQETPEYRRRLPHPELPRLVTAMAPVIARSPVRTAWETRRQREPVAA